MYMQWLLDLDVLALRESDNWRLSWKTRQVYYFDSICVLDKDIQYFAHETKK